MNPVFLSASVPYIKKGVPGNETHVRTADPLAIRDAVIALLEVVLPRAELYFGGHPAITPMVRRVAQTRSLLHRVKNYQSAWFLERFPDDNEHFEHLIVIPARETLDESLRVMRAQMLGNRKFSAAFFIGGMQGIKDEYELFRKLHGPGPPCFPVASTGGAALELLEFAPIQHRSDLLGDTNYVPLFRRLLGIQ